MSKVLVTGGAGFIGSHTVDALILEGHEVRILDNLDPQVHPDRRTPPWLNPGAELVIADVRDRDAVKQALKGVDMVVHDAAAVGVGQSQYRIEEYVSVNVGGTATLLDVLANEKHQVRKLLVASSMSIYGEGAYHCHAHGTVYPELRPEEQLREWDWDAHCPHCDAHVSPVPTTEAKPLRCTSIYAQSKKDQEEYVHIFGRTYGIPTIAVRYFNAYGPRQSMSNPYTGVAAIFSSRIKNGHAPLVYEDGHQSRDFISVHDIVSAKLHLLADDRAAFGSFNIGTGRRTSILQIANTLLDLYGRRDLGVEVTGQFRKGDIRDCYADTSRIAELGWQAKVSLEDGMAELVRWGEANEAKDDVASAHDELLQHGLVV